MEEKNTLIISNNDYEKIYNLLTSAQNEIQDFLQNELDRATLVDDEKLPEEVVSMNSTVTYKDLSTQKTNKVTLVYPHEANIEEGKVSILAPIGAALIGLRVGQKLRWPLPQGKEKEIEVIKVEREAAK